MDGLFEFLNNQSGERLVLYGFVVIVLFSVLIIGISDLFDSFMSIFRTKILANSNKEDNKTEKDYVDVKEKPKKR